jgi:glycosyltransferase involved in cell wall biosynthesis
VKVALVTYALHIGGVETFLKRLARHFTACGHQVCLLETSQKGCWSDSFREQGFEVVRILPQALCSRVQHARRIARFLGDFDLVILNDAPFAQAGLGMLPQLSVAIPVLHMYLTSMIRNASANPGNWDALVAVCPAGAQSAVRHGADAEKVRVIANGVEVSAVYPSRSPAGSDAPLKIGYIGTVNHTQKGVLYLPGIVSCLAEAGVNFTLDVVGTGPDLEALAREFSSVLDRVTLHGALPNEQVMQMMSGFDALVIPSHFEGLPLVLLEAMSLGVVPVVSRLGGCTDFAVSDAADGFLVEVGDVPGFAAALQRLALSRELLRTMSFAAWQTASERFSSERTGDAYLALAKAALDARCRGPQALRTHSLDLTLLGDFPRLPLFAVRPVRKLLRALGLFPQPTAEPLLSVAAGEP